MAMESAVFDVSLRFDASLRFGSVEGVLTCAVGRLLRGANVAE